MKYKFVQAVGGFRKGDEIDLPNSLVSQAVLNSWIKGGKVTEAKNIKTKAKPKTSGKPVKVRTRKPVE